MEKSVEQNDNITSATQTANRHRGDSAGTKWLRLQASKARGMGLTPGQGIKIPQAARSSQKEESYGQSENQLQRSNQY